MRLSKRTAPLAVCFALGWFADAWAASPSAEQALKLVPIQQGIDFDRPDAAEAAGCKIGARKVNGNVGWMIESPTGVLLRNFVDTNGDNVVDQWSYYKDGLEVYRDIDADYNGKADQYRWFHTAGGRWGQDRDEDGTIDSWKRISAEEVTAEVVAALATRDARRFERLMLTSSELKSLGASPAKAKLLADKIGGLDAEFQQLAASQREVGRDTEWIQFSGNRPGIVPAGTDGSTKDIAVYENVVVVVQTGDEHGQVQIGTLVEVGDVWRVIELPQPIAGASTEVAASGFFFRGAAADVAQMTSNGPNEQTQSLLAELEKLDAAAAGAGSVSEQAQYNARRADIIERVAAQAGTPDDRAMWIRQLADMVSAAVQSGGYPDGTKRLESLAGKLQQNDSDRQLAAYVRFRQLTADYGESIQNASSSEFVKIQESWLERLEQFANQYPDSPDAAEAMLQLAIAQEFAGEEDEAKKWYGHIVQKFSNTPAAAKSAGAITRLDSVGRTISLKGTGPTGETVDIAAFRGNVLLIQYWASWCEPCKADMATIKELLGKYGRSGFNVVGINLDSNLQDMTDYLAGNRLPWQQIREEGGLDSRPANELGIVTLPTMILLDRDGKVVNRNVHVAELDGDLSTLFRAGELTKINR